MLGSNLDLSDLVLDILHKAWKTEGKINNFCGFKDSSIFHLEDNVFNVLVLGGIPVHTEYRCLFFLRYEFF